MAKKKSRIKEVVETVESWVGMGPKAQKKTATKTGCEKVAAQDCQERQEGGERKKQVKRASDSATATCVRIVAI